MKNKVFGLLVFISFYSKGQSIADSVLYIELKQNTNQIFRNRKIIHPNDYLTSNKLTENKEDIFIVWECQNGSHFEFRSYHKENAKTVSYRKLKRYPIISFPQLCDFLTSLPANQKEALKEKWAEMYGLPPDGIGHPESPGEMYLFNLKEIYFVERDMKKKRATITLVYYHNEYM